MKRHVRFKDDSDEIPNSRLRKNDNEGEEKTTLTNEATLTDDYEKKHTLDSDEEDEPEKYVRYNSEHFEGQEDATQEYDGKIKIMAFNMKDDLEDGHFASDGTFIFNKKSETIKDAWLDNVDWDNAKNAAGKLWHEDKKEESEDDSEPPCADLENVYERLLKILSKPTETINAALKRLNSEKGLSMADERKQRWAAKKAGRSFEANNAKIVAELTSLADTLISSGHMNAYQLDATAAQAQLDKLRKPKETPAAAVSIAADPFDMFGDEPVEQASTFSKVDEGKASDNSAAADDETATMWEFRAKNKEGKLEDKVHGPFPSNQMEEMKESELLKHGGMVRKVGTDIFYDMKRIDFDLYD